MSKPSRANQIAIALGLTRYAITATFRNRNSLVFGLLFPLGFVVVFGFFGSNTSKVSVGLSSEFAHSSDPLVQVLQTVSKLPDSPLDLVDGTAAELETKLAAGKVNAVLEPPQDGQSTVKVVTTTANPVARVTVLGVLNGIFDKYALRRAEVAAGPEYHSPIAVQMRDIASRPSRYIDFALPGLIGFSIISGASFGVAFPFLSLRRTLVLKRMLATPAKPISFVVSQCLGRSVQSVMQAAIILGVGVVAFHFYLPQGLLTFFEMLVLALLGILSFMGFGIFLSNIAKDEQTAPLVLNFFNLPQFLLSGVFFPIDGMPQWVQVIGNNLPLSFLNIALRKISTPGGQLQDVLPQVAGMVIWSLIAYSAAAKTFKVE